MPKPITNDQREAELAAYARDQQAVAGVEHLRFFPQSISGGLGAWLRTSAGREVLDFSASWTAAAFGHGNEAVAEAISAAARNGGGASVLSSAIDETTRLAEGLIDLVPLRETDRAEKRAYLGLGGTDANTVAIAAARHVTGRSGIVAFRGSYHGGHGPSEQVSGIGIPVGQDAPQSRLVEYPVAQSDLDHTRAQLTSLLATEDFAAVIVEAVQCDGGVLVPPADFLPLVRELCDAHGVLLVVDEVKAGLGRTGQLLAYQATDVRPDLVTLGKSLGGGLPVSAAVGPRDALSEPRASALLTTAGAPIPAAAANAVLDLLEDGSLARRTARLGEIARQALETYRASDRPGHAAVVDVRGRGLLLGLELGSVAGFSPDQVAALAVYRAWELGCALYVVRDNVLEITPPLVIGEAELLEGIECILTAIDDVAAKHVPLDTIAQYGGW
ncbi:aminotransferase class III-fold pyridoxal phosphate-dependent enzyme [Gulosibacter molinativorax]|uniref:aminotransferase class III-fold pyridoxal phosphate-dependent enzyme n=1 Tax=Gulosibacter molinativorax TaxID=256821 RepID=UPI00041D989D|nr:aminotransferase class III-fold pyridoxal phosphate-dependent enzyme [Gulosibacter molinativorax]QUY61094.1 Acetylornithine aminotransferase ArgD [Gulosibacter molinativorax]